MATDIEFKIKLIIGDVLELSEREEELTQNIHLLASYSYDWNNSLFRLTNIWNQISDDQKRVISDVYESVKPLAKKLKLSWPEELQSV